MITPKSTLPTPTAIVSANISEVQEDLFELTEAESIIIFSDPINFAEDLVDEDSSQLPDPSQSLPVREKSLHGSLKSSKASQPLLSSSSSSKASQPQSSSSKASQPGLSSSKASQPGLSSSKASQPGLSSSKASQPGPSSSKTSQPGASSSKTSQPLSSSSKASVHGSSNAHLVPAVRLQSPSPSLDDSFLSPSPSRCSKRKKSEVSSSDVMSAAVETLKNLDKEKPSDRFSMTGVTIGNTLRLLSDDQCAEAERIIFRTLYLGKKNLLTPDTYQ